jgi:hypothetical protein
MALVPADSDKYDILETIGKSSALAKTWSEAHEQQVEVLSVSFAKFAASQMDMYVDMAIQSPAS